MQLEYFADGYDGGPLILLYGDSSVEVRRLREALVRLSQEMGERIALHGLEFVKALDDMALTAVSAPKDEGVVSLKPGEFEWALRPETWVTVIGLLEPFCIPDEPAHTRFQHLNSWGGAQVIYSTKRGW